MTDGAAYLGSMTRTFAGIGRLEGRAASANLLDGGSPNYRCYTCADGRYVAVGALEPQFWAALCTAIGQDPATAPSPYDAAQHDACTAMLESTFATRTRDEWAAVFAPLDACVAPVLTLAEALAHPHNVARGTYVEVGGAAVPGPAPRFSATPGTRPGSRVEVGRDTVALLDRGRLHRRRDRPHCAPRRVDLNARPASVVVMDYKLELVLVPVSDVDAAKAFYVDKVGFVADHDQRVNESLRFVQLTPPGSACSIALGEGLTTMTPGSLEGLQLVVDDADAGPRRVRRPRAGRRRRAGPAVGPVRLFADPDGNRWSVQEIVRPA